MKENERPRETKRMRVNSEREAFAEFSVLLLQLSLTQILYALNHSEFYKKSDCLPVGFSHKINIKCSGDLVSQWIVGVSDKGNNVQNSPEDSENRTLWWPIGIVSLISTSCSNIKVSYQQQIKWYIF